MIFTIGLFALDKLALIEGLRAYGRPEPTPIENILIHLRRVADELQKDEHEKPVYVIFGTSRSDRFKNLHPDVIRSAPELTQAEKDELLNVRFETRAILKASEMFLQFTLLETMVRAGANPDLIIMEVSPEMFNGGGPYNMNLYVSNHIYDQTLLRKTLAFLDGRARYEAVKRLFFATYAYRFRPERALMNFFRGVRPAEQSHGASLLGMFDPIQALPENYEDFEEDDIPPEVFEKRFEGYADHLEKANVLMNYRFEQAEYDAFVAILDMVREKNVPLVLWTPYVHETLEKRWRSNMNRENNPVYPELWPEIAERDIPYFNASAHDMRCRRFTDSSHLSARCSPYLMWEIVKTARARYGE